ncbi:hypothetical protein [Neisseria shayeganii]|uniref:Uncharacterized protein n=1 Tax=Neisseria shayeganii TaxID=607712 RepID=A0A7D7T5E0_9NEIS|nr:hypothetical protein [Neisseria shayeganii]QMT40013.1 hypothetical protein H3L94_09160 [Neisseria shayeganii]
MSESKRKILENISNINQEIARENEIAARFLYQEKYESAAQNFFNLFGLNQKLGIEFAKLAQHFSDEDLED